MKKDKFFAIGVMSGTSFDGIDISLILSDGKNHFRPIKSSFYKFPLTIRQKLSQISKNFNDNQYEAVYRLSRNTSLVGGMNRTENNNYFHIKYRVKYYY